MIFRKAVSEDSLFIAESLKDILALHAAGRGDIFRSEGAKYGEADIIKMLDEDNKYVFVVQNNGTLCGYAICNAVIKKDHPVLKDRKVFYLDDLYLLPSCRGKGTGRAFMDFLTDFAQKQGFEYFELNVWEFDGSASSFYEKCGLTTQRRIMEKKL